jgi:hypothetical protein
MDLSLRFIFSVFHECCHGGERFSLFSRIPDFTAPNTKDSYSLENHTCLGGLFYNL